MSILTWHKGRKGYHYLLVDGLEFGEAYVAEATPGRWRGCFNEAGSALLDEVDAKAWVKQQVADRLLAILATGGAEIRAAAGVS